jgi:hypothetical protein
VKNILISWIGSHDLDYAAGIRLENGPVISLLNSFHCQKFDMIYLLINNWRKIDFNKFRQIINNQRLDEKIKYVKFQFKDPSNYAKIYSSLEKVINSIKLDENIKFHFFLSPGSPQMSSIMLIMGLSEYKAELYKAYIDKSTNNSYVKKIKRPFSLKLLQNNNCQIKS